MSARTGGRRALRAALALTLVPVVLLAVEGGYRGWLAARGAPWNVRAAHEEIVQVLATFRSPLPIPESIEDEDEEAAQELLGGLQILHPYVAFDMAATYARIAEEVAYFRAPESEATYDVLLLGGSVANRFGRFGVERLTELLREDPRFAARPIRFLNHAVAAHKQPQLALRLGYLLALGLRPDAVIVLDGFNELALGRANAAHGVHPSFPDLPSWSRHARGHFNDWSAIEKLHEVASAREDALALGRRALDWGLYRSCVAGRLVLRRLRALRARSVSAGDAYQVIADQGEDEGFARGPRFQPELAAVLRTAATIWSRSSLEIWAVCRERGIDYVHVLQPTLHDQGSKPLTHGEVKKGQTLETWVEAAREGYPLLRAEGRRLAAAGLPFLDASGVFRSERQRLYFDACHFRPRGHLILAEAIAPAFLASAGDRR